MLGRYIDDLYYNGEIDKLSELNNIISYHVSQKIILKTMKQLSLSQEEAVIVVIFGNNINI